jgi:hypothetical protein
MRPTNSFAASGKPRPAASYCQTTSWTSSQAQTMTFKNEVVSDADIDRYNLPFHKGDGRWWTRDAEHDYYLWGGLSGNPAFGTDQEGKFYLYADGNLYFVIIQVREDTSEGKDSHFIRKWEEVTRIVPEPRDDIQRIYLEKIIKSALIVYGIDGQDDGWSKKVVVLFGF